MQDCCWPCWFGGAAGFVNGGLVVWGRIDAFIVTLGTMAIIRSPITWMSDGGSILLDFALRDVGWRFYYGTVLGIPVPVLIFAVRAIRVNRVRLATCVLQGLCVGLATLIYIPRLGAVTPSTGML